MLTQETTTKIADFVKKEPRTIQDVAKHIGRAWLTANSYVQKIQDQTGLLSIKTFRAGTQGALKLVYYNFAESVSTDEIRKDLYEQIKLKRFKYEFDFLEIFQYISEDKKASVFEEDIGQRESSVKFLAPLLQQAEQSITVFSGNLSFVHLNENNQPIIEVLEELLKRKVTIKIVTNVNITTQDSIQKLSPLLEKYKSFIEIRHRTQPLRGFIIDNKIASFRQEEHTEYYRKGELTGNIRIFYDIYDESWISWLQSVFWNLFRSSLDYTTRLNELSRLLEKR